MKDTVIPQGKWKFDDEVANCFDNMLERSIPDYFNMRELVYNVGKHYVVPHTTIMDIGCSNGSASLPFVKTFAYENDFILTDVSDSFIDICKRGFKNYPNVCVKKHDLRNGIPEPHNNTSLILSVLTIQFTPIEYRQRIIDSIYNALIPGGCFIFVEKLIGNTYSIDSVFVDEYYAIKKENQYTNEQIQNKRKSLEGVLVPVTANWNVELLKSSGFKTVDCFWRYLNFAGFIAIK